MTQSQYKGKTGEKSGSQRRNRQLRTKQLDNVTRYREIRKIGFKRMVSLMQTNAPSAPYSVWKGIGAEYNGSRQRIGAKITWRNLSDHEKFLYASRVIIEHRGYCITAKINSSLSLKWLSGKQDIYDLVRKALVAALNSRGLKDILLCFVIEGKTKKGCKTSLHLHGMFAGVDRTRLAAVKLAFEEALEAGVYRGGKGSFKDVCIEPYTDYGLVNGVDAGTDWAEYCTKHLMKPDARTPTRRIYINPRLRTELKIFFEAFLDP